MANKFSLAVATFFVFLTICKTQRRCNPPPQWTVEGLDPMVEARAKGKAVVLTLLVAT